MKETRRPRLRDGRENLVDAIRVPQQCEARVIPSLGVAKDSVRLFRGLEHRGERKGGLLHHGERSAQSGSFVPAAGGAGGEELVAQWRKTAR